MITSLQNPRIKAARKLSERKERYATRQYLVEGVRLIGDAWQNNIRPLAVFYAPELVAANPAAEDLLAALELAECETLACSTAVFNTLSETVTPQGIVAVLPLPHLPAPPTLTFALLLDGVRDPGNAGALLRSAAAAGVELVVFGPQTVDPFNEKVVRAGMGAHSRIPIRVYPTWSHVLQAIGAGLSLYLADASGSVTYDQVDWAQPCALAVGGEANGATAEARVEATSITIPMQAGVESLNAAIAGSVILFEASRQRRITR